MSGLGFRAQSACGFPLQQSSLKRYEQMVRDLYRYRLRTITFLEMLDKWEHLLGISSESLLASEQSNYPRQNAEKLWRADDAHHNS